MAMRIHLNSPFFTQNIGHFKTGVTTVNIEQLQNEINERDKQLREIASSLMLLEGQLQRERKRMVSEMSLKEEELYDVRKQNDELMLRMGDLEEKSGYMVDQNRDQEAKIGILTDANTKLLNGLLKYTNNKPTKPMQSAQPHTDSDREIRGSRDKEQRRSYCHLSRRSQSVDRAMANLKDKPESSRPVVIERRTRERRFEKFPSQMNTTTTSDSSEEEQNRDTKSSNTERALSAERITKNTSSRNQAGENGGMNSEIKRKSRHAKIARKNEKITSSTSSSDNEPSSTSCSSQSPPSSFSAASSPGETYQFKRTNSKRRKATTLPARCDGSALMKQWTKTELEQGIVI
jgi:hypothetical protein